MLLDRRHFLEGSSALLAGAAISPVPAAPPQHSLPAFYDDIEQRTFRFFWETVNRKNGLVPDRWPTPSFSSIAAVGLALPAYAIGAERGWCSRSEARELTLTTLRFFWNAPQGPGRTGVTGNAGFFYHFLDMDRGTRYRDTELSSVDTTFLLMGALFAGQYFNGDEPGEREIRDLSDKLFARADWNFFRSDGRKAISMGWHPGSRELIEANWVGYNEGMFVNVLALGSPTHPAPANIWQQWTSRYPSYWRGEGPTRHVGFGPLLGHQYSHIWIDFRGIQDAVMREAGFDYFENSRRATLANWAWCSVNRMKWQGYSDRIWGLSACDGPGDFERMFNGELRQFHGYAARGPLIEPEGLDDGTIAPTAALGSLPFAPEIVVPSAEAMLRVHGDRIFRKYGFVDSFNPSFTFTDARVATGSVDPKLGWVASDYLGIDQGPILLQAANYRDDFIWRHMRRVPAIRRGLQRAGFTGGWLASGPAQRG
jgi:hypothetical protein